MGWVRVVFYPADITPTHAFTCVDGVPNIISTTSFVLRVSVCENLRSVISSSMRVWIFYV